ncbi:fimbrial protein [Klebsiella sp. S69]|uniref:fimbrial protein n=1 Tax=Klebsiella sp. S69 TaxID=2767439 RepID=UPI00190858D9|nr:fimbrial protein [Klebsiella sp. S69]MBK0167386.1 fimbrial protein [Klebsiella sp. S69]
MFTNFKMTLLFSFFTLLNTQNVYAATVENSRSGSNSYLFIENNIDKEYFITPDTLDPRFSGSNVWTKYKTNQESLGYMGFGTTRSNRYVDLWITNSPINSPFLGLRCRNDGSNCPSSGYLSASVVDKEGFYHARSGASIANGNQPYGLFSSSAFEFFRTQGVGSSTKFVINWCATNSSSYDYDFASGKRCKDLSDNEASWETYTLTSTKLGHLSLESTGSLSEIWVASDGTPSVTENTAWCRTGIVGGSNGIICKMVSYKLEENKSINSLRFGMVIDTAQLGFTPSSTDVKFSGASNVWFNWNTNSTKAQDIFSSGNNFVEVFFSTSFFNKALQTGANLTGKDTLFTFNFRNTNTPQSGYYQFTASNQVNIVPKEYGISIVPTNGNSKPQSTGTIGSAEPIEFEYRVTTSASRQADSITAQVVGESTLINGTPYCLFVSTDGSLSVPIPAYLSWTDKSGAIVNRRNSCVEQPIDMTSALWTQTPWNAAIDNSFYFETLLKLKFPMNDSRSQFTTSGNDWLGTVSASGEIKMTATWIGVDK